MWPAIFYKVPKRKMLEILMVWYVVSRCICIGYVCGHMFRKVLSWVDTKNDSRAVHELIPNFWVHRKVTCRLKTMSSEDKLYVQLFHLCSDQSALRHSHWSKQQPQNSVFTEILLNSLFLKRIVECLHSATSSGHPMCVWRFGEYRRQI